VAEHVPQFSLNVGGDREGRTPGSKEIKESWIGLTESWPGLQLHQVINNPPELPGSMIDEFVVLA
jgi:hypothetical protein